RGPDLERDEFGQLLPGRGEGGGDRQAARRRHEDARRADRRGQDRPDGRGPQAGGEGRTDLPPRQLRVPAEQVGLGCGGGLPAAAAGRATGLWTWTSGAFSTVFL